MIAMADPLDGAEPMPEPKPEALMTDTEHLQTQLAAMEAEIHRLRAQLAPEPTPVAPVRTMHDVVTVKNRWPQAFHYRWDSVEYAIPALGEAKAPRWLADHAKKTSLFQENLVTEEVIFGVGIVENGDDCSPMPACYLTEERMERLAWPPNYAKKNAAGQPLRRMFQDLGPEARADLRDRPEGPSTAAGARTGVAAIVPRA